MAEWLSRNFWRFGLASGILMAVASIGFAQLPFPAPDDVVKVAEKNAMLAVIYVMAGVTVMALWFAWRMYTTQQLAYKEQQVEMQRVLSKLLEAQSLSNAKSDRLVDALNVRPCIMAPPQALNPHLLKTGEPQ